jgi:hypothetical protein
MVGNPLTHPSVVRCAVVSATFRPAISGSTLSAASAKLSLRAPAKLTKRSAPGVKDRAVNPTCSSHGNTPLPQRPQ